MVQLDEYFFQQLYWLQLDFLDSKLAHKDNFLYDLRNKMYCHFDKAVDLAVLVCNSS